MGQDNNFFTVKNRQIGVRNLQAILGDCGIGIGTVWVLSQICIMILNNSNFIQRLSNLQDMLN